MELLPSIHRQQLRTNMSDSDMVTKTCLLSKEVEHIIFQEASVYLIKKHIINEIKDSKNFMKKSFAPALVDHLTFSQQK